MTQSNAAPIYQIGDVVTLVDSTTGKSLPRPALVLADIGDNDILVARITTHQVRDNFDVGINDLTATGLNRPSIVRPHKLATIEKRLVSQKLGALSGNDLVRVRNSFGLLGI